MCESVICSYSIQHLWSCPGDHQRKQNSARARLTYAITTTRYSPSNGITKRADDSHTETILFTPQANNPDPSLATEPLLTERYLVEELEENFEYSFSVGVMNQGGTGMSSEPLVQVMPEAGMYN